MKTLSASFVGVLLAFAPASVWSDRVPAWIERLGWTLVHSVWQLAVVAIIAAIVDRALRRRSADARYIAGVTALGMMLTLPCVTWLSLSLKAPNDNASRAASAPGQLPNAANIPGADATRLASNVEGPDEREFGTSTFLNSPTNDSITSDRVGSQDRIADRQPATSPRTSGWQRLLATARTTIEPRLPWLVALWIAGVVLCSLRPAWGLWTQSRLRRVGLSPVSETVQRMLLDLSQRMRLARVVRIAESALVRVPMVVGYLRPMILLPASVLTGLTPTQLEAVLAHELAHVRRHDWLVNALQVLAETLLFYHPAVWWLSNRIRHERELCCDDFALSLINDKAVFARTLLILEELRQSAFTPALAATGGDLAHRVRRLLPTAQVSRQPTRGAGATVLVTLCLSLALLFGVSVASRRTIATESSDPPTRAERGSSAGRGSPDPALDPTAGLPNADEDTNPTNIARLPGGQELEVVGVARAGLNAASGTQRKGSDWWRADGTSFDNETFKKLRSLSVTPSLAASGSKHFREFVIRLETRPKELATPENVKRAAWNGDLWFGIWQKHPGAVTWDESNNWQTGRDGIPTYNWLHQTVVGFDQEQPAAIAFYFTNATIINAGTIAPDGKIEASESASTSIKSWLQDVKVAGIEKSETETAVKLNRWYSQIISSQVFVQAIALDGTIVTPNDPQVLDRFVFKLKFSDIDAFQIKVRPMTHRVDCEEIALLPSQKCNPRVTVTPLDECYSITFRKEGRTLGKLSDLRPNQLAENLKLLQPDLNTEQCELIVTSEKQSALEFAERVVKQLQADGWKWPKLTLKPLDKTAEVTTVEKATRILEFRFAAQPADSKVEPRVPADFLKRHYPDNSPVGRKVAKDSGFIWIRVTNPKDGKVSLPLEGVRGNDLRVALLADTAEHALLADGTWSVEAARAAPDPLSNGNFSIELTLNEAGGAAMSALTKTHLNQPLAIVVNGEIIASPIVRSEIGRNITITGSFTREQAEQLAKAILVMDEKPAAVTVRGEDNSGGPSDTRREDAKKNEPKPGAQLKPATEQMLRWGEPVNGLRMALAWPPTFDEPGMSVAQEFYLVVQNVTQAAVRLTANDAAPNPRHLTLYDATPVSRTVDDVPMPGDWLLQPREVAFVRLFHSQGKRDDGRTFSAVKEQIVRVQPQYRYMAEMSIPQAPAGAWTGKLVTGSTRGSADVIQPQSKESRALFQQWQRTARTNGNIPGGTLGPLVRVMRNFVKNNPTHEGAPKFAELLKRIEVTRDWSRDEAVKLLDEVAAIYPSLPEWVEGEKRFKLGGDVVVGKPLPEELKNAPWGEAAPNGLRVAWLLEPRALKYRLGTPLKSRILFHNAGKNSVVFRALTWNQSGEHKAADAQGTEIHINSVEWTTMPMTFACRLAPGEFLEVIGAGIGVGANTDDEDWRDFRVGAWIEAKAGDEVTFSPAAVHCDARDAGQPEGEEVATPKNWWLKFISDRLSLDAPPPAAADERRRLLNRAVRDLFGNEPTPEEITALTTDAAPDALNALAKRLANRAGFVPFSGSLKSGTRKFLVLPPDPDAAKKPRSAKGPGQYTLGGATFVVTRRPIGERVVNEAHLSFSQPDATKPARKSHPVPLPDDYDTWIAAWMRGGTVLWVAQKGVDKKESIQRYEFTNPESVTETVINDLKPSEALPQAILDVLSPTSPRAGLEFLKPYPKLHGLSLDMTEPQFLEIVKQQELKTRKTVDGEKVTHHIALGDDHTLIVMFDKEGKCSGIQRVRGEDNSGEPPEPRVLRKPAVLLPDHWIMQAVGFDNGGKELVTASNQSFITIRRWDMVGMKLISEIKLQADKHGRQFREGTLMLSDDRRRVIAATDAYVGIWETATGKLLKQLPIPKIEDNDTVRILSCTPDFSVIVGGLETNYERFTLVFDAHTVVWDGNSGKMLRTLTHKGQNNFMALSLSSDGKRFATTNGGATIWDTSTGQQLLHVPNDNKGRKHADPEVGSDATRNVWSIHLSPDGKQLAMGDTLGVKLVDAQSGKLLQLLDGPYRYSSGRSPGLVFSKDGQWLTRLGTRGETVAGKADYVVPIWSTQTGQKRFELHTNANDAAFSDDGQRLAVVFSDLQQALSVWTLSGDAADVEQTVGPGPHSRQDRVEENGHYVGKTAAELIEKFQPTWGNEKLGLQYGIALTKPQRQFRSGERVPLVVFFRNVSDKPIKFDTAPDFFGNTPKVLNAKSEPIALENIPLLGSVPHYHETLEPGEALGPFYLSFGLGENPRPGQQHWHPYFKTPVAGQYKLTHSASINVASPKDGEPSKRDGITTGTIEFEIVNTKSRSDEEARILRELEADTSVALENVPFSDAVSLIAKQYKLPIIIGVGQFQELKIKTDTPVTLTC